MLQWLVQHKLHIKVIRFTFVRLKIETNAKIRVTGIQSGIKLDRIKELYSAIAKVYILLIYPPSDGHKQKSKFSSP